MNQTTAAPIKELSHKLVTLAKKHGATHADALSIIDTGESIDVRHGKLESIEREDSRGVGLRAFVQTSKGLAFASASTSDVSDLGLEQLAQQVIAMANISEPDPDSIPPEGANHPNSDAIRAWEEKYPHQHHNWNTEQAKGAALACEAAALDYSESIANSEGASASFGEVTVAYASSDGFTSDYTRASCALSLSVIAGKGEGMQRDYAYDRARIASTLASPKSIGEEAAQRALRREGASALHSQNATVIFEPRIATSILSHLTSAINGRSVVQKNSFLTDAVQQQIFPDFIHISDQPDCPEGMGNRLFDGEGTHCKKRNIIDAGVLTGFLTDRYAAKRLGVEATGHARRGLTGDTGIGTSNLILQPSELSIDAMLKEIHQGVWITELMGFGVNGVTGDYSRGAAGFLVEHGEITKPVQAFTIAGNLKDMFANISHIGNDLTWFGATATPSIAIANMTIAGEK